MAQKKTPFTVPGLTVTDGHKVAAILQERLHTLNDLHLTLKHIHWNVVGYGFIGVHKMLDPQIECVRDWADEVAERIAALGVAPNGLSGALVKERTWDDYALHRATVPEHLAALDLVWTGVIEDYRESIEKLGDLDPVSEDLLIGHVGEMEIYQWFVRAHLQDASGALLHEGATTEKQAADIVEEETVAKKPARRTRKAPASRSSKSSSK